MKLFVIILNWNGAAMLRRFLPSVLAGTPASLSNGRVSVEVIVADNGSTDDSRELLASDFPNVARLDLGQNRGFAEGYNRAIAQIRAAQTAAATGSADDVFVLLNSDVETPAGWLEPLVQTLTEHPRVAAVAPKLLSISAPDRFEYAGASGGLVDFFGYPYCRGRVFGRTERDRGQYDDARRVLWGSGACLALRGSAWDEVGELDGDFFAHQEEIDWCWRAQLAGWSVMVEPASAVLHLGGGTLAPSPRKVFLNFRNNLATLYKNLPAGRMQFVLAVRWLLDLALAEAYLVAGQRDTAKAVCDGWQEFLHWLGAPDAPIGTATGKTSGSFSGLSLRQKRQKIQSARRARRAAGQPTRPVGLGGLVLLKWLAMRRN